jgi:hypothetical protein
MFFATKNKASIRKKDEGIFFYLKKSKVMKTKDGTEQENIVRTWVV